ncbi:PE-PPE domain-containing protein [Mycobacterium asiaticum]|uniref:PE-PPE domain-containing protein n=1 Tax=Mycobacterium asiaticum TaxID=1790 RepID=UPI0009B8C686|nr:PE-PPE domain-containing protein [Mycobacterium asiaticum]ORA09400.1 hypothetical protein BST16_24760 [Mycobacterium asiaticum DSM 44297]
MSYVVTAPDLLACAASDLSALGTAVDAANRVAAHSVTSLLTAGADEVSSRIADLFSAHGRDYQAVSAQAARYGERLVRTLAANADAYLGTEIFNAAQPPQPPLPAAGVRLTVPGAGPLYAPRLLTELPILGQIALQGVSAPWSVSVLQAYGLLNPMIGENWFPASLAEVVGYPASMGILSGSPLAPTVNEAVAMGRLTLDQMITGAVAGSGGAPVQIAGLSMGSIVVNRELAYLATSPTAPPPGALQFALFSSPELGLAATYLPSGMTVPLIGYTVQPLAASQYNVSVVFGQYDFFANPPDRPWNLPAVVNSLFGTLYQHNATSVAAMSNAVELSSVTNSLGGTVTTYMIPSPTLPMLLPLVQLGVPPPIVNGLNAVLQPMVNAGYSSLTPGAGPYFSGGSLVGWPNT